MSPTDAVAELQRANQLLAAHAPGSGEFERAVELLTRAAEEDNLAEAQWHLGALYLQVLTLPDAERLALYWLERAAERGVAPAMDRLADLHLTGRGTAQNDRQAFHLQQRLAAMGYAPAQCTLGYMYTQGLGTGPDLEQAADCFLHGVALGYPPAYFGLGVRLALGAGAPVERVLACAMLQRAADGGYPHAQETLAKLPLDTAQRQSAQEWHGRLKQNYDAAKPALERLRAAGEAGAEPATLQEQVKAIEARFAAIGHPSIGLDGAGRLLLQGERGRNQQLQARPDEPVVRCEHPRVVTCQRFATLEECAHLMAQVHPRLRGVHQLPQSSALFGEKAFFDGQSATFGPLLADAVVRNLERRMAAAVQYPLPHFEPLSVVRYRGDQQYKTHVDYLTPELLEQGRARGEFSGQRPVTFLLYLNTPQGGGTHYPRAGFTVQGERGMALIHHNTLPNGDIDEHSVHAGLPVEGGAKWLLRCAIHERPLGGGSH